MLDWFRKVDYKLFISVLALSIFGIIMIYSASMYTAGLQYNDAFYHVKKQALSLVVGLIFALIVSRVDLKLLLKYKYLILAVSIILLALVFVPFLSVSKYGATRWINIGVGTIQPSELSKFGLAIFLAGYLHDKDMRKLKYIFTALAICMVFALLIMLEPNMSITICVVLVVVILLFASGVKWQFFVAMALPALAVGALLIIMEPYRWDRIIAFLDPWKYPKAEGYQLIQSYYALGSGGFFGVGLFNSRQKYLFLPFAESDFIFSIIGEELGFVGGFIMLALCMYIIFRGIVIAINAEDRYLSLLTVGLISVFAVQVILNIAVVSGAVPPTGLPLPYVSAGGSSIIAFWCSLGLLLNISYEKPRTLNILRP